MSLNESFYNIKFQYQNYNYVFNSLRCGLVKLGKAFNDNFEFLNICANIDEPSNLKLLEKEGFLVDSSLDEFKLLEYINTKSKFSCDTFTFTLFPTFNCNCSCTYCYEKKSSLSNGIMDKKICDCILNIIESVAKKHKNISIIWHGGEPLLAKDVIWYISEKTLFLTKKYNVKYDAFVISNLCLIDEDTINNFLKFNILNVQVTIDGMPETHNKRRILKNGEPTFDLILKNILKLQSKNINVDLRINIDKFNKDEIFNLVNLLKSSGVYINDNLYLGHLRGHQSDKFHDYLSTKEYANVLVTLQRYLIENFCNINLKRWFPKFKGRLCQSDSFDSLSIDLEGNIYKCWHDAGNRNYAMANVQKFNLLPGLSPNLSYALYSLSTNKKCKDCSILPLCLCGCPKDRVSNDYCSEYKYNLIEILKIFIDNNNDKLDNNELTILQRANNIDKIFFERG